MKANTCLLLLILLIHIHTQSLFAQQSPTKENLEYAIAKERPLLLDLYLPVGTASKPYLIVWIHGGAWHSGSKEDPPLGLLSHGYALASVDYRLSVEARFPAQIHDIKAAVRYLRAKADEYGYRQDKIIIWGASAGGHLVASAGTSNGNKELEGNLGDYLSESSDIDVILDFYGPTNFLTILAQSTPHGISVRAPALALLLGKPLNQVESLARLASPVFQVDNQDPPILIVHGDQDIQVPVNQALELHAAYQKAGALSQLEIVPGAGHGSPDFYEESFLEVVVDFLNKALKD